MGRIDQDTVNRILDAADIVDVVSDFVKLRRSGANFKGLCPFHNERTPSFSVNRARNICKCFSCGKGGTPVNFIMEHEQMSYTEALRYLARKYNIEVVEKDITPEERQAQNEREAMLAINEFALKHFEHNLLETNDGRDIALAYFRHRGINDAMIQRFHLGYSIDRGSELIDAARDAGFNTRYLVETGLAVESERDGHKSMYDRFRGRVMFPVHSISGRVIAFGGRTMRSDKSTAKYVNSPESAIYKKNLELYGLYQAKNAIAKRDKCILVEGYLDVISMHQAGVENVVASSGTSLTTGQIRAIRRFTDNVTLIYDADAAGIKASLRGINMLLEEGLNVKTLLLPPGDDPDSFAQSHTSTEVEDYLSKNETDIIAFMTNILMKDVPAGDPTAKAKVINVILGSIAYIDEPVKRQEYIAQSSRSLGVPEDVLIRQLNIFITRRYEEADKNTRREQARQSLGENTEAEKKESDAPLLDLSDNSLRPYEEMIMRYIVRYGLRYIADITQPDGSIKPGTVFDLVDSELKLDGIEMTYAPFKRTYEAVRTLRCGTWEEERKAFAEKTDREYQGRLRAERDRILASAESMTIIENEDRRIVTGLDRWREEQINDYDASYTQSHLANSSDDEIRSVATRLITERYSLSKIFLKQTGVETEEQQLRTLVPRAIYELRNAILTKIIESLGERLKNLAPDKAEEAISIMQQIQEYKEMQSELGKILGERIILPSHI